jgi:hypothetical protein
MARSHGGPPVIRIVLVAAPARTDGDQSDSARLYANAAYALRAVARY